LELQSDSEECTRIIKLETHTPKPVDNADDLVLQDLISRIMARVNSLALRITGNIQLAEEVTEDTFFQIWRQAPRFDPSRGTARAWILTIARSRALDARRSIPPFDELTESESVDNSNNQDLNSPQDILSNLEQYQILDHALKTLDHLPRQLIALAFFKGLSHEEIAAYTSLPLGTVKSHIRRAVIQLREALLNTAKPIVKMP
jgi:RNA polymerase sigma factor (sigma-70 family)